MAVHSSSRDYSEARIKAFTHPGAAHLSLVFLRNAISGSNIETPLSQGLRKKLIQRCCTGSFQCADGNIPLVPTDPNFNITDAAIGSATLKYTLDHLLSVAENQVMCVVWIGQMLLLRSGDVEENPGPLTKGKISRTLHHQNIN